MRRLTHEHAPRDVRSHPGSGLPDGGAALAEGNPHVGRFLGGIEAAPRARARLASHRGRDRPVRSGAAPRTGRSRPDRKSTRLNSSHSQISYAVFCLKKKKTTSVTTAQVLTRTVSLK